MKRKREKAKTGTESIEAIGTFLTTREASQLLNIHGNTLRRWSNQGKIKAYRIGPGRHRRFKAQDLAAFIVEQAKRLRADTNRPQ